MPPILRKGWPGISRNKRKNGVPAVQREGEAVMSVARKDRCSGLPATESQALAESLQKRRGILVVDDEEMIQSVLSLYFQQRNTPLWVASSGLKALEIYRDHRDEIGLVLLDVKMPGWDGPYTYTKLKDLDQKLVCYFMSGNWDPYTEEDLLSLGAAALLDKPFHFQEIDDILQMHHLQ